MTEPWYDDGQVVIYCADALDVIDSVGPVDMVVTDPPYAFGLASTSGEGKSGSWADLMNNARWYSDWLAMIRARLNSKQGACWVFNSWRSFPTLARAGMTAGWPITSLMVWDKEWIGPGGLMGLRPRYELVALFASPDFVIDDRSQPDIWRHKWSSKKPNGHPAEKPVGLVERMLTARRGPIPEVVLDPFMGSGTTLVAAKRLGVRRIIGIEWEERWCHVAAARIAQGAFDITARDCPT